MTVSIAVPGTARTERRRSSGAVRFLLAAGTSSYGDWLSTVALVVLLYRLTGTVTGPALYILVRVAPRVLGPGFGGSLADRIGPARVAAACALLQGGLTASVLLLAQHQVAWAIYLVVAAAQLTGSMAQPAYSAVIPRVVRPEHLRRINGAYQAIFESSVLVAPALGALLLTHLSPLVLIAIDALSFAVAAALLVTVHVAPVVSTGASAARRSLATGFAVVRRDAMLRAFAAAHFCSGVVITCLQAVLVIAATQRFGSDVAVGWLYAAVGAGGVSGSIVALTLRVHRVSARFIVAGTLLELVPLALFSIVSNVALCMMLLFASTFVAAVYQTSGYVGLQQRVPMELMGRVNAVMRQGLYTGMLIGAIGAATLVQLLGWVSLVLVTSGFAVLALALMTMRPRAAYLTGVRAGFRSAMAHPVSAAPRTARLSPRGSR
ncbi:MAG: MFS transporter [Candidatus Dormibacteraeota bacterium]|nr:MFS transporter [Candidatus Dormibacteraeota bacterium]MBV9524655.1 MFS transporter [Candidatus Dormibacteraeota bacterium]